MTPVTLPAADSPSSPNTSVFPHENLSQGNVAEADNFCILQHSGPDKDEQTEAKHFVFNNTS